VTSSAPNPFSGDPDPDFAGFFAHQVVNNACATLAVLNGLGNIPSLRSGPQLAELMSFTNGMDPQTRGMAITSSDWLREAHNALSPPSAISLDGLGLPKTTEEAYHFVVYLPALSCLYELDGLKEHPVNHGPYDPTGEGWLKLARYLSSILLSFASTLLKTCRDVIEARIATYPMGSVRHHPLSHSLIRLSPNSSWNSVSSPSGMIL